MTIKLKAPKNVTATLIKREGSTDTYQLSRTIRAGETVRFDLPTLQGKTPVKHRKA